MCIYFNILQRKKIFQQKNNKNKTQKFFFISIVKSLIKTKANIKKKNIKMIYINRFFV